MDKQHPRWNFKEFCAFLLLYAAMADFVITKEEKAMILKKVDEPFYLEIKKEIEEKNDIEIIDTLLSYKGIYFPTTERKQELMTMIKREFYADGDFSQLEIDLYRALNKLL